MKFVALDPGYIYIEHLNQIGAIEGISDFKYYPTSPADDDELMTRIGDANMITGRIYCRISKTVIDQAKALKAVFTQTVGFDHIDVAYAKTKGIKVYNCPGYSAVAVAELTFSLIISLFRKIPGAQEHVRAGGVNYRLFEGIELRNKVLGVIGAGNIGTNVVKIGKGFGMKVLVSTKNPSSQRAAALGIESFSDLTYVLKTADVLVLAVALNAETKNLIGKKQLELLKKSSYLINISRPGIVDEYELAKRLISGRLAGAATDIFIHDPFKVNTYPMLIQEMANLPNVIITPHIGSETKEANFTLGLITHQNIRNFLKGVPTNCVNC